MNQTAPLYLANAQLNKIECAMGRAYLESMPRHMTIVLGNGCNINCLHCYQEKNGDNLLLNKSIGLELRREFLQIYPYLQTLRIQGGEIFALNGFKELLDDISHSIDRPLVSTSTNGTLIDESWCRRIVETPFQAVTFSLDAGTSQTYERLRRGSNFEKVIGNIRRLQNYKLARNSWYPNIDSFYVIMRSNFREIPQFLELMLELHVHEVAFQTLLVDERNVQREPKLLDEKIVFPEDIKELHQILKNAVTQYGHEFDVLSFSGLKSMFGKLDLDTEFLNEEKNSLVPCQDKVRKERMGLAQPKKEAKEPPSAENEILMQQARNGQCPNPWTTLFVTENGDVSLCFLSEPVGNVYKTPLVDIWNNRQAVAKRSRILAGNYTESGCSGLWCDWRDGKATDPPGNDGWEKLLESFRTLTSQLRNDNRALSAPPDDANLQAVRRILKARDNRIVELESNLQLLWDDNVKIFTVMERQISKLKGQLKGTDKLQAQLFDLMWARKIWRFMKIAWKSKRIK